MSSKQSSLLPFFVITAAATCVALYLYQKSTSSSKPPPSDDKKDIDTSVQKENWGWHVNTEPPTPDQANWHVQKPEQPKGAKDSSLNLPSDAPPKKEKSTTEAKATAVPLTKRASSSSLSDKAAEAAKLQTGEEPVNTKNTTAAQETVVESKSILVPSEEKPHEQSPADLEESAVLVEKEPAPEKVEESPETDHPSPTPASVETEPMISAEKTSAAATTSEPSSKSAEQPAPEDTSAEAKPQDEVPQAEAAKIETAPEEVSNQSDVVSPTNSIPPELPTPQNQTAAIEEKKNDSDLWDYLQEEIQKVTTKCEGCGKEETDTKFKPCAKCRNVVYCGRACQKKHWKQHKKFCCK